MLYSIKNLFSPVGGGSTLARRPEHNNKYKFAIAFENEDYPGYVTEKICDIYKSNCIPIYWGTKEVTMDFNPKSSGAWHGLSSLRLDRC